MAGLNLEKVIGGRSKSPLEKGINGSESLMAALLRSGSPSALGRVGVKVVRGMTPSGISLLTLGMKSLRFGCAA
jgi:hypothetical protein